MRIWEKAIVSNIYKQLPDEIDDSKIEYQSFNIAEEIYTKIGGHIVYGLVQVVYGEQILKEISYWWVEKDGELIDCISSKLFWQYYVGSGKNMHMTHRIQATYIHDFLNTKLASKGTNAMDMQKCMKELEGVFKIKMRENQNSTVFKEFYEYTFDNLYGLMYVDFSNIVFLMLDIPTRDIIGAAHWDRSESKFNKLKRLNNNTYDNSLKDIVKRALVLEKLIPQRELSMYD